MNSFVFFILCGFAVSYAQKVDVYSRPRQLERSHDFDVLHYRISLRFDERTKSLFGETKITVRPLTDNFTTCVLDAETYTVRSVYDKDKKPLSFAHIKGSLTISFPSAYRSRDTLAFTVVYDGTNVDVNGEQYGVSKDYDLGLDFKQETPENPQLINTLSFPAGARHWFPCYDHPNDKATSEVIATVRSSYSVLSNGRLVEILENKQDSTRTFHWSQELPHSTYLFVLVAGPYVAIKDSLGQLPVNYWVYPKDEKDAPRSFRRTPEIIAFFEKEFGCRYPWVKYDQITIPGIGGGAESTTATVVGENTIHDERADQDFSSHWLVAHEAAHQWWGNLVTMRDWNHTWINESFATYYEYYFARMDLGEDEGALNLLSKKEQYLAEARDRYQRPIVFDRWTYPNDNFDRHTYQKGALVLHMLRWIMGEDSFRASVAHFLKKHSFEPVSTDDFLVAIREATGQVLDDFFKQWIYKAGHPVFQVSSTWDAGRRVVRLKISQVQELNDWIPVFSTPLDIGVTTASGKKIHRIQVTKAVENIELPSNDRPLLVRFDEGNHVLHELKFQRSTEELLYQLEHDDATGRIEAARELKAQAGDQTVRRALQRRAQVDSFWAVRKEAISALGSSKSPTLTAFFKERFADKKSGVRVAAARALGELKDSSLAQYFKQQFSADDSYLVQAALLKSLGQCGAVSSILFLRDASLLPSPRNVLQSSAKTAMDELTKARP
ncbi:MAG: hypothetical protein HW374_809 [Bacteroidetes bacterium]|nr:hypothetical protein [Bacteroidota bacterium]